MSATSHFGAPSWALPADGWQGLASGAMASVLSEGRQGIDPQQIKGALDVGQVGAGHAQVAGGGIE
jgi:hypothetical protein